MKPETCGKCWRCRLARALALIGSIFRSRAWKLVYAVLALALVVYLIHADWKLTLPALAVGITAGASMNEWLNRKLLAALRQLATDQVMAELIAKLMNERIESRATLPPIQQPKPKEIN